MRVSGRARGGLEIPARPLDCGNTGTSMRLLLGVLAAVPGRVTLEGDASLSSRPMERVARPLRTMGAEIETTGGHAPVSIRGGRLVGSRIAAEVPSAQVKGAVLLAGLAAEEETEFVEPTPTRDHTERILHALGAIPEPVPRVRACEVPAFRADVPGDVSGAAFLAAAAAASGGSVSIAGVGLNPTRLGFATLLRRMGVVVVAEPARASLGEPIGTLEVRSGSTLRGIEVSESEVAGAIDEIPALALLCALAEGPSRFRGVAELRVKESDRVTAILEAIRALGGGAEVEGEDLVVAGGGLDGGRVDPRGDHRIAMAAASVGPGCRGPVEVLDADCASVSFPGFARTLRSVGADVEG
jgi:3-phosphoshikimate 1-carboxyvinyltransferase